MKKLKDIVKEDMSHLENAVDNISHDIDQLMKSPNGVIAVLGYLLGTLRSKGKIDIKDFERAVASAKSYRR